MLETYVLDASGVQRSTFDFTCGDYVMPSSVYSELVDELAKSAVENGIRNGRIKIVESSENMIEKVSGTASDSGDILCLSGPDLDVLAVALEKRLTIVSDDYAIQNVASKLGLKVVSNVHDGIEKTIDWVWVCTGCGKRMDAPGVCPVCGHRSKKRPAKK